MGWQLTDNRIALNTGSELYYPTAEEIVSLNRGESPANPLFSGYPDPASELPIRFSRLGATHKLLLEYTSENRIVLTLLAIRGKSEVKLSFKDSTVPDSVVINDVWHNLLATTDLISELFAKVKISEPGAIQLTQYALLKKELASNSNIDVVDYAEEILANHPMLANDSENPATLNAKLYPYQQHGYQWMRFIANEQCGCILGDEMGLGKTLQVITLLTDRKAKGYGPALVIAPVSLLENWRREFAKFTEGMNVFIHHGSHRTGLYTDLLQYDVVVISYNTAVTDLSLLKMISWDALVLDEAQNIKNPSAQRTKAVKELQRTTAIAVTGTPLENHLTDIWSIMDFILPGYLGKLSNFSRDFSDDIDGATSLEPLVTPFMIRRRVGEVAQDLPERIDIPQILTLSEKEADCYEAVRTQILEEYDGKKATLPMLQKLRMFCTHPALLDSGLPLEPQKISVKYERLCEILDEIIQLGEKAILFTSYNRMFDLLEQDIPKRFGIRVLAINGSTPPEERQLIIDKFSGIAGSALLVLNPRAAGAGLNITAASRVIHYNLEWNPALEDQASARAYRRGQNKTVFVYRLYYENTVEEVINERIEKKREMFSAAVIGVDGEHENSEDIMRALMISPGGGFHE